MSSDPKATRIIVTWRIEMQTVMEHGRVYQVPRVVMGPMRTERICVPEQFAERDRQDI